MSLSLVSDDTLKQGMLWCEVLSYVYKAFGSMSALHLPEPSDTSHSKIAKYLPLWPPPPQLPPLEKGYGRIAQ